MYVVPWHFNLSHVGPFLWSLAIVRIKYHGQNIQSKFLRTACEINKVTVSINCCKGVKNFVNFIFCCCLYSNNLKVMMKAIETIYVTFSYSNTFDWNCKYSHFYKRALN